MGAVLTRRELLALLLAVPALPAAAGAGAAPPMLRARRGPHPTPRPGITADGVVPDDRLVIATTSVLAAFGAVRRIPQIVDGIHCYCGCAHIEGHYSLLSCYEQGGMAQHCEICQGQARMALRLHGEGRTLDQIRAAIDARYG